MAYRLANPLTSVGALLNFWRNASLRLWAGSVEMMSTDSRTPASCVSRSGGGRSTQGQEPCQAPALVASRVSQQPRTQACLPFP